MELSAVAVMGYVFSHPRGFAATRRSRLTKSRRVMCLSLMGDLPVGLGAAAKPSPKSTAPRLGVKRPQESLRSGVARLSG